jgi:hypothetical protein
MVSKEDMDIGIISGLKCEKHIGAMEDYSKEKSKIEVLVFFHIKPARYDRLLITPVLAVIGILKK